MGDSIEQWRATVGQWSGGRPRQCVKLQHCIAQSSNHIGYRPIRFLVLLSLLVIGCVELNPGPDHETSASSQTASHPKKFHRRGGTDVLHGGMYEMKMAAFLFARALHKTEEFYLASNVEGTGAFDDLVFRYRMREPDVWKTCFIQLKHKKSEGTIKLSSLIQMSGDFSLFKYFDTYCQIKSNSNTDRNLKQCGQFDDFEFVIYTNARMEINSLIQEGDSDPVSILSSGPNYWKCTIFGEKRDEVSFDFFKELSEYYGLIVELDNLLKRGSFVDKEINEKIESFQNSVKNQEILYSLNSLKSTFSNEGVKQLIKKIAKYDFDLFKEFLSKVKIFQSQSNEKSFKQLIEKELQDTCRASTSVVNSIYAKYEEGFSGWSRKEGNVIWLKKDSHLWQEVDNHLITEIKEITEPELQKIEACGIRFKQQHIQRLCDAVKQNTFLNIVTNSNIHTVQKLKTYQALDTLGYTNSLFIGLKSLMIRRKEICKLWPCKWSAVLVIDCDCDGDVADILLNILQQSVGCKQGSDISDVNKGQTCVDILQNYRHKVIVISSQHHKNQASTLRERFGNFYRAYEDNCKYSDLDEMSQKKILERTVNFQGKNVALQTLVGTDPQECIKLHIDADVISVLLSGEGKLCIGRNLDITPKYYVQRSLEHRVYLKDDVVKETDKAITFAVSGLQADQLKKYLPVGEKLCEFVYNEREKNHSFKICSEFSKNGFSAEWENMKSHHNIEEATKPEDVRYVILGDLKPESDFRKLKELCTNVHWIHMEKGSFLWRNSNSNIDIIRRYIDNTKCKKYDMKRVMEHDDRTMLLVAEPGMGKSTFLSHMEHEIKKQNPSVWVLRINLNEHTNALENIEFEDKCIGKCKKFLWNAARSPEQDTLQLVKKIFTQALGHTEKMVIILDGFDEISPDYSLKVQRLIRAIRKETSSKIWVSSRFSHRQYLEDLTIKLTFTLQPFTRENQIQFLEQYWKENIKIHKPRNLEIFAKELLSLCSKNFSDKDGEFTGIPLQTMMLGEAFMKEAVEYCSKWKFNLLEKFNLLDLFQKFWQKKCDIYFSGKNGMDSTKPEVKRQKLIFLQNHMVSALITLFSPNKENGLLGAINPSDLMQTKSFLGSSSAENFGLISHITDEKPHFIHRCFAEYFAAKWFTDNFKNCKIFFCNTLFKSTYEVTRNIFDRMLAGDSKIHGAVLNNDLSALEELMKNKTDINISDKGGRTALHLAASYNNPLIQTLLSGPGVNVNKRDKVLQWTAIKYADRTKSWMSMDILLQNGANPDDIVFTKSKSGAQEWEQRALWECASKGHGKLLEFLLDCGSDVNAVAKVPENQLLKCTLFHRASYCGQTEVVKILVDRKCDINRPTAKNHTALHLAAESGSVDIINLLLDEGMSVNVTNTNDNSPLHVSALRGQLEATKTLVERDAALNNTNKYGNTPLMLAAFKSESEIFRYLTEFGADINIPNKNDDRALHFAALSDSVDIIKLLVDKGMSVNLTNTNGQTPLYAAAQYGKLEATKTLVERGAALNVTTKYGNTPLMEAAFKSESEIFRYLTEFGAYINIRNNYDDSALHFAALSDSVDIIKLLVDKGMSVNLTNTRGQTPLHVAAQYGKLEATKTLVERGAALNVTNKNGITPLMAAALEGKTEVFHYLKENGAKISIRNNDNNNAFH